MVTFEFTFALSDVLWPATNSDEPQSCGIENPQNRNDAIITNWWKMKSQNLILRRTRYILSWMVLCIVNLFVQPHVSQELCTGVTLMRQNSVNIGLCVWRFEGNVG